MLFSRILALATAAMSFLPLACSAEQRQKGSPSERYTEARHRMVQYQIEGRGIADSTVLAAMRKVERHRFVPQHSRTQAYNDYPLPIGEGQTISQPYIVALMTELLALAGDEKVLEVGTGSGYQAAILGEIAEEVYTVEIVPELAERSRGLLAELGYENITVKEGDGYQGWPEKAPFEAIIVTCAPPEIPQPLIEQLAEGGRMVIPVGTIEQVLVLLEKREGELRKSNILHVRFVPMTGKGVEGND